MVINVSLTQMKKGHGLEVFMTNPGEIFFFIHFQEMKKEKMLLIMEFGIKLELKP